MKPILFNTEMVRAILDGRKTVTRRVVKGIDQDAKFLSLEENPSTVAIAKDGAEYIKPLDGLYADFVQAGAPKFPLIKAPYCPGDILYVRETWYYETFYEGAHYDPDPDLPSGRRSWRYVFKADNPGYPTFPDHWRPSIHMPKEAARLFLRVTDVRVERLHNMTADSAMDEGFTDWNDVVRVWDSTIKKADLLLYGWAASPWVWVIEFERISKEDAK